MTPPPGEPTFSARQTVRSRTGATYRIVAGTDGGPVFEDRDGGRFYLVVGWRGDRSYGPTRYVRATSLRPAEAA
jgi:hypothetical protein